MDRLPHTADRIDLLNWVAANPNEPFDPSMVVTLGTGHSTDWEWQAVLAQMEDLRLQGYITRLKQDATGVTHWIITASGRNYLHALNGFVRTQDIERLYPQSSTVPRGSASVKLAGGWETLEDLGEGGQSKVFLVRSPSRVQKRQHVVQEILRSNLWAPYVGSNPSEQVERVDRFVTSLMEYARPEIYSELGALKMFKIPEDVAEAEEALARLKNEVTVLRQNRPGLVKLLDVNEQESWIVTKYMPNKTLEKKPAAFKGNAVGALKAFRSLVETVSGLHQDHYVHRDIKPANVFFAEHERLALGDFGIVFIPDQRERMTLTNERVGPRDYMPQWGDLGERLNRVHTNFDVYMLGKLLWCMVTGRLKLPREYHDRPGYDIKVLFPSDPHMRVVDTIIQKCVVEEPDQCLDSAGELLAIVDEQLTMLEHGGQLLTKGVPRPCRACGKGHYHRVDLDKNVAGNPVVNLSMAGMPIEVSMFTCDVCDHAQFFREG